MSLRSKIILVLSAVVVAYVGVDHLIQRSVFKRQLGAVEQSRAEEDLTRVVGVLEEQQAVLGVRAFDWATRDSVRRAFTVASSTALDEELAAGLEEHELDLLYVCGPDGEVRWARSEHPETRQPVSLKQLPKGQLAPTNPLVKRSGSEDGAVTGLLMTRDHGALMLASHSIAAAGTGEPLGTLILGRFLDGELVQELGEEMIRVAFDLTSLQTPELPEEERFLLDQITTAAGPVHWTGSDGNLHVYTTLRDILRAPTILLRTTIEPTISRGGQRLVNYALVSAVGTGLLIVLILLRLLSGIVIAPLGRLTKSAMQISRTDDTSVRTNIQRDDEIGLLSAEFDSMLEKLDASRREVIRTARLAGMSEIATGVLHNVGNVLNSVNVSANLVTRKTEELPVRDLGTMREVLAEHEDDLGTFVTEDARGKHLLPFLTELYNSLDTQRKTILEELGGLSKGVEHMGELVRSQQSFAGRAGVLEPTSLARQFEAALAICRQAGRDARDVEVVHDYEDLGDVEIDRHKIMEILVNLIKNALDAMDEAGTEEKSLTLRIRGLAEERVQLEVTDSGPGIAADDLARIFNHGFTTKKDGHGYGLHVSANAAVEMKGSLHAESDGPGRGATFVLELPAKRCTPAVAA